MTNTGNTKVPSWNSIPGNYALFKNSLDFIPGREHVNYLFVSQI